MKSIFLLLLFIIPFALLYSQDNSEWKISAQIQARSELDGRDFSNKTNPITFTSLRTRVGVEKTMLEKINMMVQIQDSRIWGQEQNTLSSIDNVDIHQAYFKINKILGSAFSLQAGRFEMKYGTERFIGAVGWHYVGRAFDGARLIYDGITNVDLFGVNLVENQDYISNAASTVYPFPLNKNTSYSMYGFWNSNKFSLINTFDVFGFYEIGRRGTTPGSEKLDRFTIGLNYLGNLGFFEMISEGALQTGKTSDKDILAYLVSFQGFMNTQQFKYGIGIDILSGTGPDSDKYGTFNPSFGTNHKFYGFMDYFINIPGNTNQLGLHDYYLIADWIPKTNSFSASINLHQFTSNRVLELITENSEKLSNFGQEVDLTLRYQVIKGSVLTWGGSFFIPGKLMKYIFRTPNGERSNPGFWSYLMATITF